MSDSSKLEIVNIVASGSLGTGELDTDAVGDMLSTDHVDVHPSRVHFREKDGSPVVMLYRSGTYTIAGAKSRESLEETVEWMTEQLRSISAPIGSPLDSLQVKYIVFLTEIGHEIDLLKLSLHLKTEHVEYEPEQFPGLFYAPPSLDSTILIFSSGRIVITGGDSRENAREALELVMLKIQSME